MRLDKNNTKGFTQIEPGEYEVFPHVYAEEVAKSSGNKMVVFNYLIRDDVEQNFQGKEIRFDNFVETDGALWRINQASEAAGLDMDKEYPGGVYEWAKDFVNKAVRIRTGLRKAPNGKEYPEVTEFMPSRYGGTYTPKDEAANNPVANQGSEVDISDDDLPF